MNLTDPMFNLREVAKHLLLLEDHLSHPDKCCSDCVQKHLLTCEALLDEAMSLDLTGLMTSLCSQAANQVRKWIVSLCEGESCLRISQDIRAIRKGLTPLVFDPRGEQSVERIASAYLHRQKSGSVLKPTDETTFMGGTIYQANIKQDRFVHFTLRDRVEQILSSGRLLMNPPYPKYGTDTVNAISLVYGDYVPNTQVTHIKDPKSAKEAILFQTPTVPKYGYVEEVVWDRDVVLQRPKVVPVQRAVSLLKATPERIESDDMVVYS